MVDEYSRDDFWRSVSKVVYDVAPVDGSKGGLAGSVRSEPFGEMILGHTSFNDQICRRARHNIADGPADIYIVQLLVRGEYRGDFDGADVCARPGDIFFLDMDRTLDSRKDAGSRLSVVVPRGYLHQVLPNRDLHGSVLKAERAATRLLADYMRGIGKVVGGLRPDDVPAVQESLMALIGATVNGAGIDTARSLPLGLPLRARILEHIEANLYDPRLSPQSILKRFPVSRSALYRAFEADGGIARIIRDKRLDRAYRMLVRNDARLLTVREAATLSGFPEGTQFARFFRRRFGVLPHEVREALPSRQNASGSLALHAHLAEETARLPTT